MNLFPKTSKALRHGLGWLMLILTAAGVQGLFLRSAYVDHTANGVAPLLFEVFLAFVAAAIWLVQS